MSETTSKPELHNYLDIHDYLKDLYTYRKKSETGFSYESWAQELGFHNRSFLRQVIVGRRSLTEATIQVLCERLNLNSIDREYFHLLVLYSRARSPEQRNLYGRKLRQLIRNGYEQAEVADFQEFISTPLVPQVQMLLSFEDTEKTPQGLARLLGRPHHDVQDALQTLHSIRMAEETDGTWVSRQRALKVSDRLGNRALQSFHEQCLLEAARAKELPVADRRYRTLLVSLNEEEKEKFLQELEVFVKQTLSQYDPREFAGRKLFQINVNLHAVASEAGMAADRAETATI